MLEAPVLARALYAHAELDREIPAALFAAVAQVLAYVYQLRAALRGYVRDAGRAAGARASECPHEARIATDADLTAGRSAAAQMTSGGYELNPLMQSCSGSARTRRRSAP